MLEPRCSTDAAHIAEVFSAIQGEGVRVGERQIFLRFLECHIHCPYCDTPDQDPTKVRPKLEQTPGRRDWEVVDNPVSRAQLEAAIGRLQRHPGLHKSVSYTGGEPLWYWPMIEALAPALAALGLSAYLETDGLLPDELDRVIEHIAIVAMDVKLNWRSHDFLQREPTLAFLRRALAAPVELQLKVVLPAELDSGAFEGVLRALAAEAAGKAPLILQPVTPYGPVERGPGPEELLRIQELASRWYPDCRVVPQVHKLISQR